MALLKFKRSAVAGKVPSLSDLPLGELALNTFDGKIYMRKDNGIASIVEVAGGAGGVQSITSTDGSVTITGTSSVPNLSVAVAGATSNVLLPVRNNTGAILTKGTAVYINGALGQLSTVAKAIATSDATSAQTLGIVTADIAHNANGNVTLIGTVTNLDTSAFTDGQQLYLSPSVAGTLTATKPYAPNHLVYMAVVEHAHPTQGKLFVKVQNGYEMDELHDVSAQSPANNYGLFYNTATNLWEAKGITTALGYTPANKAGETFTGVVSIYNTNDAQLYLNGNGTTWAGIAFTDVTNSDYLFYNGSTSTFSIGGGGSAVANKKLHINGGVTIGSGLSGTAVAANGLLVETQVAAPIFYDSNDTYYRIDLTDFSRVYQLDATNYLSAPTFYSRGDYNLLNTAQNNYNSVIVRNNGDDWIVYGGAGGVRAPIFYDSNNTAFYVSPDDNSFVSAVRARGQIRATGWWDSYSGSVNGLGIEIGQSGSRSFVISYNRDTGNYGPVSFDATDFLFTGSSGGYAHINTSFRAPVFYDSNNTAFYVDAEGTSNLNQINLGDSTKFIRGGATGQVILGTGGVNEAYLQVGGNYHSIWNAGNFDPATKANLGSQNIFTGVNYFFSGGNPQSGTNPSLQAWTNDNASGAWMSFHRSNQYAINIGLDSSNVFRIGGWSAPSDLFSLNMDGDLAVKRFISAGTGGFRQSAYNANARNRIYSFADADGYGVSYFQGTAGVGSADTIGMHFGLATGGGSQFIFVASGYGQASASFRAPFFYDSDNTGYYIDAAGTSLLNGLVTAGSLTVGTGADSYIYMADSDQGTRIIHNNSNQIGFLTQAGNWGAFCTDDGGWYSVSAMYAPIYYDLNDTNFYVDANNTSNFNSLTLNGGAVYRSDWTTRFQSSSDFVDGTLVTTNIPATATNGESFIIEITGKSYDGSNPPFKVIAQGYLYNDTIIAYSGISYGGNFASSIKVFEDGGVLKFWWPRISYWNSFNVNVMGMDGPNSGTITRNRITSITNSTEPTGTKKQTIALARFMRSDTAATNSSALYAPLFYDSNDTNYFIDPTSTSVLNTVRLNAAQYSTGSTAMTLGSTYFQLNDPTGRTAVFLGGADPNNYYDNTSHNFRDRNGSLYAYITPSGIWAGAFTDYNNTAYYVDPASNSVLNALYLRNGAGVEALAANASSFGYSSSYRAVVLGNQYLTTISLGYDPASNASGQFNGQGEGREVLFRNGVQFITPNAANNNYLTSFGMADGYSYSAGSFRAPIFYDTDNTGFYVNPQSGSVLGGQVSFAGGTYIATNGDVYARRDAGTTGVYYFADGGSKYLYWDGGSYIFGSAGWVYSNTPFQSYASVRAPIFYDSDNTAYFVDPTNRSRLVSIDYGNGDYYLAGGDWGYRHNTPYGWIQFGPANSSHAHIYTDRSNFYFNAQLQVLGGSQINQNDIRSPIFYDTANTSYYLNINGASKLATLTLDGMLLLSDLNIGGNLTVGVDQVVSNIFMTDTDEGVRTIHCNSNQIGFLTQASAWGAFCTDDGAWYSNTAMYAPIYYDLNDTSRYTDPNGTSILNSLTVVNRISGGIDGDAETLYNYTGANSGGLQYWNLINNSTLNPDTDWWYGLRMAHGDADTYYNVTLAVSFFGDEFRFRRKAGGVDQSWRRLWHNGDSTISASGDFRAPIFYDSNNTSYYVDPNDLSRMNAIAVEGRVSIAEGQYFYMGGTATVEQNWGYRAWTTGGNHYSNARSHTFDNNGYGSTYSFVINSTGNVSASVDMRAPLFYDSNNTGYYVNPDSTTNLYSLVLSGNTYFQPNSWIQFNGAYGCYWPSNNDAHLVATTNASYSQIEIRGSRGGYGGIFDFYSGVNGFMYDGVGNGGVYREANGRWYFYHNLANNCTGFGTSTTVSGWSIYVPAGVYSDSRIDASLFYDVSNTSFYLDPNATGTSLNVAGAIVAAGNVTAFSDIRVKDNIETVPDALTKLSAIRGVTYTRTDRDDKERRYAGVIAQEIEQVLPEAIFGDENIKTVDYNATIALLIEAVKELKSEVETLKAAIRSK